METEQSGSGNQAPSGGPQYRDGSSSEYTASVLRPRNVTEEALRSVVCTLL